MNKQEILRQLQSRIDKRSNEITEVEDFYKNECGIMVAIADHEKEYLDELRWEQTLDKRIIGYLIRDERLWQEYVEEYVEEYSGLTKMNCG